MALAKCTECSNEISSDAATCPKCGANNPNHNLLKKKNKTRNYIIGAAIIAGMILLGSPHKNTTPTPTSQSIPALPTAAITPPKQQPDKEIYQTTARHLFAEYEKNEVATDEFLKNKKVILFGEIQSINKDFTDSIVIELRTSNQFMSASMHMNDSEKSHVLTLQKGDKTALTCASISRLMGAPLGTDCIFATPSKPYPNYQ